MNSKALVVVVLLIAGLLGWFVLRADGDIPPAPAGGQTTVGGGNGKVVDAAAELARGAVERGEGPREEQTDRTAAVAESGKAAGPTVTIRGRLVDARSTPRPGIELELESWKVDPSIEFIDMPGPGPGGMAGDDTKRPKVTTRDDGTFAFAMAADHSGWLDLTDADLVFADDGPRFDGRKGDRDLGDVVALRSGALQGVVQDEHGRPAPGVKVSATLGVFAFGTTSSGTTDANGSFSVGKLRAGAWSLRTASDKFQPTLQEVTLKAEERRTDLVVVVRPGQAIAGQVTDDLGMPVAGCKVGSKRREARGGMDIERFASDEATTTDAGGFFTLSGLTTETATVRAYGRGHTSAVAKDVPVGTGNLQLRVDRLAEIRGVLVAADGAPIAGSAVRAMPAPRDGQPGIETDFDSLDFGERASAKTGADGSFAISGVKPGPTILVAEGKQHRPVRQRGLDVRPAQKVEGIRLVADAGATAKVKVVDTTGKAVAGATVRVERPHERQAGEQGLAHGHRARTVEAIGDSEEGSFSMSVGGDDDALGSAKTDENGMASVPGLPEGPAAVVASHAEHAEAEPVRVMLPKTGVVDASLTMRVPGFVEAHVVGVDGAPVEDCALAVRGTDNDSTRRGTTDAKGLARIGPLLPGPYSVVLTRGQHGMRDGDMFVVLSDESEGLVGTQQQCQVVAGETVRVEIVRPVLTRLSGVVTGVDGPLPGCRVELERSGRGPEIQGFGERGAKTAADGSYALDDLESGKYTLRYGKPDQVVKSTIEIDVPPNTPELRRDLEVRTGKLRVQACATGTTEPIGGAAVEIVPPRDPAQSDGQPTERRVMMVAFLAGDEGGGATSMTMGAPRTRTGADGWAEIDDVPAGTWTIRITHDRCAPVEKSGQVVVERQVTNCGRVDLDRAGTIRGKVLAADGSPVQFALVQCREIDTKEWGEPEVAQGGEFRLTGRKAGRHVVRARLIGNAGRSGWGPEVEVTAVAGETVTTEARLPVN